MQFIETPSYTYDDVMLLPGFADFGREDITDLSTNLTPNIKLSVPFVAAPMDTVCESELASALGRLGGIGIIHRNLSPDQQIKEVLKVKQEGVLVGAAISARPGYQQHVENLLDAKADVILVDSAHGYTSMVLDCIKYIKEHYSTEVIGGNVATRDGAKALFDVGTDAARVGMGPGSICTTRLVTGMGVGQVTAVTDATEVAREYGKFVIADGGVTYPGDVVKGLAAGASTIMLGKILAATEESCAKMVELTPEQVPSRFKSITEQHKDKYMFKLYRGMGSMAAIKHGLANKLGEEFHGKSLSDPHIVPEGVEGLVPLSGSVADIVGQLSDGLKSGMYYIGALTLGQISSVAKLRVASEGTRRESHPHDIYVINGNHA